MDEPATLPLPSALAAADLHRLPGVLDAQVWRPQAAVPGLAVDSRSAGPGRGFFALQGQVTDGHRYAGAAAEAGAPALFLSEAGHYARLAAAYVDPTRRPAGLAALCRVPPGRAVLADLAAALYRHPSRHLALLGVTGTNGKTTVTHLVLQLLEALGRPAGLIGTLGMHRPGTVVENARTTPEAPDLQDFLAGCVVEGVGHVAMEVSSIGVALERTRGLRFAAAGFTNLTHEHLDFHEHMEEYEAQKQRLFFPEQPPPPGVCVANGEDAAGRRLIARWQREHRGQPCLPFALDGQAPLTVRDLRPAALGWQGTLVHDGESAPFTLPLPGDFNVANLLTAVGLLRGAGLPLADLAGAAQTLRGAPGRFERVPVGRGLTVVVDYAHKPDALANVLREARKIAGANGGRLHVLFGCGGDRDRGKRPLMGRIAEEQADAVVITDDNPRTEDPAAIRAEIVAGLKDAGAAREIGDRGEAIAALLAGGRPGDVLVLAGKGHEPYQEIAGVKHPFDDREQVRARAAAHAPA